MVSYSVAVKVRLATVIINVIVTRDGQAASSSQCYASIIKSEAMVQQPIDSGAFYKGQFYT